MGLGHSSGQYLMIHNNTIFNFEREEVKVICGKQLKTPGVIFPLKNDEPISIHLPYIANSGCTSSSWGSEIEYKYRIVDTPDGVKWYLKIISNGAYYRMNAYCVVQVLKANKMMAQESLWDAVSKYPSKITEACPFCLEIQKPMRRTEIGSGFYEIPIVIKMKDLLVRTIIREDEICVGEIIIETDYQDLPPGPNQMTQERIYESHTSVTRKVDNSWGRLLKFRREADCRFNIGIAVHKVDVSAKCGVTTSSSEETTHGQVVTTSEVETVVIKRLYKWTCTHETDQCKTARIENKKKIYRRNLVYRDTARDHEEIVGYDERYEYHHTVSIEPKS